MNDIYEQNELEKKVQRELSCKSTVKQVCKWMKRNRVSHCSFGEVLNLILGTDRFSTFCGRQYNGEMDEIFIIKDYIDRWRDLSDENIVLKISYQDVFIFWGRYLYPKSVGNICVEELLNKG